MLEIPEAIQLAMQSNETLAAKKQPPFRSIIFRINSLFIMLPPLFIPLYWSEKQSGPPIRLADN